MYKIVASFMIGFVCVLHGAPVRADLCGEQTYLCWVQWRSPRGNQQTWHGDVKACNVTQAEINAQLAAQLTVDYSIVPSKVSCTQMPR
jgi:hypothetical protein